MTVPLQPVEIVGGGLAGLSLGLALRRAGVPVTIIEAGDYPRHRVCGEFIAGLRPATLERLGLQPFLADAGHEDQVTWFRGAEALLRETLPAPALTLSRHQLDARLAQAFTDAGGTLVTHTRADPADTPPGRVITIGRRRADSHWIGLKVHARGLALQSGLELHLGDHAYVGLCALGNGDEVNVCGLFQRQSVRDQARTEVLLAHLRGSGLDALAARLARAEIVPESRSAVAGLGFNPPPASDPGLRLGDAYAMIPPFTGNGMASAFEMAEEALAPLIAWSRGARPWEETRARVHRRLHRRFRTRQAVAGALHPFLLSPRRQRWLVTLARLRCLPLGPLYHLLH